MQKKMPKFCIECEKYKEVDIIEFLNSRNSICNDCKFRNMIFKK